MRIGLVNMNKKRVILFVLFFSFIMYGLGMYEFAVSTNNTIRNTDGIDNIYIENSLGYFSFSSIQEAINYANSYDIINVRNGTYEENIIIDKNIALVGEDCNNTIIKGIGDRNTILVTTNGVNISGFKITNSHYLFLNTGIEIDTCIQCKIENCYFTMNMYAIHIKSSKNIILRNNQLTNNSIFISGDNLENWNSHVITSTNYMNNMPVHYLNSINKSRISNNVGQIIVSNSSNINISNQAISDSSVPLLIGFSNNLIISNNNFSHNKIGISLFKSNNNTIRSNNCQWNFIGIYQNKSHHNLVEKNNVSNSWGGIFQYNSNNTIIRNNYCNLMRDTGIFIRYSDHTIINNNSCSNSGNAGIVQTISSNNLVYDNICNFNELKGIGIHGDYNTISNNTCNSNRYLHGIGISGLNNVLINNNCSRNMIGIYTSVSENSTIKNNICNNNLENGIKFFGFGKFSKNNLVSDNICNSNNGDGIFISNSEKNIFTNNVCRSNGENGIALHGFWISAKLNEIIDNRCESNLKNGIFLNETNNNNICKNICNDNNEFGIYISSDSHDNIFSSNTYLGNIYGDIYFDNKPSDARINFLPWIILTILLLFGIILWPKVKNCWKSRKNY